MLSSESRHRLALFAIALLVVLAPVVFLVFTVGFLVFTGDVVRGDITPLEFFELYVIELALFVSLGYCLYRLTLRLVERRLAETVDAVDDADEPGADRN